MNVLLTLLETLGELADVELLVNKPGIPPHRRGISRPVLEGDF